MKINKIAVMVVALGSLMAASNLASAQDQKPGPRGRGPSAEQRLERMTAELKLTDEQKPKVKAVLEASDKKRQELFSGGGSIPREERQEKMRAVRDEEAKKLKEILTAEQYSKYEKLQEEARRSRGGEKKRGEPKKEQE